MQIVKRNLNRSKYMKILLVISVLFCFLVSFEKVHARSVQDINPSWSVENQEVEDFIKAMIQTYLFYSNYPDRSSQPNFVFLSSEALLEDGRMNKEYISRFFPDITETLISKIAGDSDQCLIFTLKTQERKMIVGVNNSEKTSNDQVIRCFMGTLAYFVDKENQENLRGENPSETARNIIDVLRERSINRR
ncbi:hypothetical protein [Labrenzia sp. DG1229]|uniref:hypothetical protein n=1 Tax=Labrenzia sp. DG1229 TaxID=681847 RepID=UPI0012EBE5F3|nr:hypothetical protein [Labrenzia sp. DG1229]